MDKQYYYLNEKEITKEEAHALPSSLGLIVSGREIKFGKEVAKTSNSFVKEKKKDVR